MVKRLEEVFIFGKVMGVKSWPFNFCQKGGGGADLSWENFPIAHMRSAYQSSKLSDVTLCWLPDVVLNFYFFFKVKHFARSCDVSWFFYRKHLTWKRAFAMQAFGKTRRKKRTNTGSFVASLGAGVQPGSTAQLCVNVIDVEKRPPRGLGFIR